MWKYEEGRFMTESVEVKQKASEKEKYGKKTEREYPASHSVDTDWFAVDKDGNLGYMHASSDTALPISVSHANENDPKYELISQVVNTDSGMVAMWKSDGGRK